MVNTIKIVISSLGRENIYLIDFNDLTISKNGIYKKISKGTCFKVLEFFTSWDREYLSNNILDGEEFLVNVYTDTKTDTFHGKGSYPKNYDSFKNFIGGL